MRIEAPVIESQTQNMLPDIPSLESVSATTAHTRWLALGIATFAALIAGGAGTLVMFLLFYKGAAPMNMWLIAIPITLAAVVFFVALRSTGCYHRWNTDASGLTGWGSFRTISVAWEDVVSVDPLPTGSAFWGYVIKTNRAKFGVVGSGSDDIALLGSVWQHLRRAGKVNDSQLDRRARGFWTPIPDWVPKDLDWHNPKALGMPSFILIFLAAVVLAVAMYYLVRLKIIREWSSWMHTIQAVPLKLLDELRRRLDAVRNLSIRADHIEARTARKSVMVSRDQVQALAWTPHGHVIVSRKPASRLVIPFQKDDRENAAVHLALIRWMREGEGARPVPVPDELLQACPSPSPKPLPERVELRSPRSLAILFAAAGLLALPFIFLLTGMSGVPRIVGIYLIVSAAACPLLAIRMGTARWIADAEGITVRSLGRTKLIRWDQVALYTVKPDWMASKSRRILKSTTGTTLLDSRSVFAAGPDAQDFWDYVDQKLQHARRDG